MVNAQLSTGVTSPYIKSSYVEAFMRKLSGGNPASVTFLGDSTGDATDEWMARAFENIGSRYPNYTVTHRTWNVAGEGYDNPTNIQTSATGQRRFVGTGTSTDRIFAIADSAANSLTGDHDIRVRVKLNTAPTAGAGSLAAKYGSAGQRSWRFEYTNSGALFFEWSADGTAVLSAATAGSLLTTALAEQVLWYRVTLDVDDGSGNRVIKFWYSADNATWTQLGSTTTTAGTTSVFDSTTDYSFNGRGGALTKAIDFYALQVHGTIDGNKPVVDLDLLSDPGTVAGTVFLDYVGNTVTVSGGTTGTFVGGCGLTLFNGSAAGSRVHYVTPSDQGDATSVTRYPRITRCPSDLTIVSYSHNELGLSDYRPKYKTLTDGLLTRWNDMGIIVALQNPRLSPANNVEEHRLRLEQVHKLAASQRFGMINNYDCIQAAGTASCINTDGIHPIQKGSELMASNATAYFLAHV